MVPTASPSAPTAAPDSPAATGIDYTVKFTVKETGGQTGATLGQVTLLFSADGTSLGSVSPSSVFTSTTLSAGGSATSRTIVANNPSTTDAAATRVEIRVAYTDQASGAAGTANGGADIAKLPTVTSLVISGQGCSPTAQGADDPMVCPASSVGTVIALTATAKMSDGSSKDVTNFSTWQTTNANVATVTNTGVVTTRGAGDTDISATYQGKINHQTVRVSLPPPGPKTSFGPGQHRINTDVAPGRYFTDPSSGCYFKRLRGFSGSIGDIIANEFIGFNAGQWIVDIPSSDVAIETDSDCGTWYNSQRRGAQTTITGGMWVVGAQLTPGTYQANVAYGCYWERLRDFSNELSGVIDNDFVSTPGTRSVTIRSSDTGFRSDDECNTWTRVSDAQGEHLASAPNESSIAAKKAARDAIRKLRR
jgi:hypothetical protein